MLQSQLAQEKKKKKNRSRIHKEHLKRIMASRNPITKLQRYDAAGGCVGIDAEYKLERCTSLELMNSSEFQRFARKFREEYLVWRYGAKGQKWAVEDPKQRIVLLPLAESDRESARLIWSARPDVRDLFMHSDRKIRADWTAGERLGWAVLNIRACLPVVRSASKDLVRLQIEHLDIKQRGEWLMDLIEYDTHLRQKDLE